MTVLPGQVRLLIVLAALFVVVATLFLLTDHDNRLLDCLTSRLDAKSGEVVDTRQSQMDGSKYQGAVSQPGAVTVCQKR